MPHLIHVFVACLAVLLFVAQGGLFAMSSVELSPISRNSWGSAHTRCAALCSAVTCAVLRCAVTCAVQ
jgi:hypothetical protein